MAKNSNERFKKMCKEKSSITNVAEEGKYSEIQKKQQPQSQLFGIIIKNWIKRNFLLNGWLLLRKPFFNGRFIHSKLA